MTKKPSKKAYRYGKKEIAFAKECRVLHNFSIKKTRQEFEKRGFKHIPDRHSIDNWGKKKDWESDRIELAELEKEDQMKKYRKVDKAIDDGLGYAIAKYFKALQDGKIDIKGVDAANFIKQWMLRRGEITERTDVTQEPFKIIVNYSKPPQDTKNKLVKLLDE